jgi:hypothetical protein
MQVYYQTVLLVRSPVLVTQGPIQGDGKLRSILEVWRIHFLHLWMVGKTQFPVAVGPKPPYLAGYKLRVPASRVTTFFDSWISSFISEPSDGFE